VKEIQLSERIFPRKVCQSGSFNRWTTSRPILSIQLNCVRFKLQDSSSDSQSNLDQRKEERELPAAEQALLAAVSSRHIKIFAGVVKPARFCRRSAPALLSSRSNSVTPMDELWTSSTDKADPKSLPGPARLYCQRRTGIVQTQALLPSHRPPVGRFVCVHCTATGHLSSGGLFLHRSAVLRHIRGSKPCFASELGYKQIHVEARAGDVMAGAGGAAGPAPDVRHQPPG
jgi:hypothetical protein